MAINPFHPTGVGIPGGVGGGVLGLGVVLTLYDQFSKQANLAKAQLAGLSGYVDATVLKLNRSMHMLQASLAGVALGMATLAAFSFPVRSAVQFEKAIQRVRVVAGDRIPREELESIAIDLAAKFPQTATEMADALRITIAAGITDVYKARHLLDSANMMAVATGSNLTTTIQGFTSFVNAYQLGLHPSQTPEAAQREYNILASQLLEVVKHGKFSASGETTDFEAMAKYFGQIAPTASALNIEIPELLSLWATATLGGQDARRSATGLRQAFMDLQNRTREPKQMERFTGWAEEQGINLYGGDLSRYVQTHGFMDFLDIVRDYSGIQNPERLEELLKTPRMQQNFETILNTLPEDMSIDEAIATSPAAKELVDAVANVGGMDISKVNEIFRSIWGLTAVLPLIGVQNERMRKTLALVRAAGENDAVGEAFNEMMNTILYQWQLFTSKVETAGVLIGNTVLAPIREFLKFLNMVIDGIIYLIKVARPLVETIMRIGIAAGMFLSVFFSLMSIASGMKVLNASFMLWMRELRFFPRYTKGGLFLMFKDVFAMTTLLVTASMVLRKAWIDDWGMINTKVTFYWTRIKKGFETLRLLFKRFDKDGKAWLSLEGYQTLVDLGIDGVVGKLFALLFRVREFSRGFVSGVKEFFDGVAGAVRAFGNALERVAFLIGADTTLARFANWLSSLFKPTQENITQWKLWGERIGWVTGLLFVLLGVIPLVLRVFQSLSAIGSLLGGSLLFFGGLNPLVRLLAILGALGGALAAVWKFVGKDRLTEFFGGLFGPERVTQFVSSVSGLRSIMGNFAFFKDAYGAEAVFRRILDLVSELFFGMDAAAVGGRMKSFFEEMLGATNAQRLIDFLGRTRDRLLEIVATLSQMRMSDVLSWLGNRFPGVVSAYQKHVAPAMERVGTFWNLSGVLAKQSGGSRIAQYADLWDGYIQEQYGIDVGSFVRRGLADVLAFVENAGPRLKKFFEDVKQWFIRAYAGMRNIGFFEFLGNIWRVLKRIGEGVMTNFSALLRGFGGGSGIGSLLYNLGELFSLLTKGNSASTFWQDFWFSFGWFLRVGIAYVDLIVMSLNQLLKILRGEFSFKDFFASIGAWWESHDVFGGAGEIWKKVFVSPTPGALMAWVFSGVLAKTALLMVRRFFMFFGLGLKRRNPLVSFMLQPFFRLFGAIFKRLGLFFSFKGMRIWVPKFLTAFKNLAKLAWPHLKDLGRLLWQGILATGRFFWPVLKAVGLFFRAALGPVFSWLSWTFSRLYVNALLWGKYLLAWGKNFVGVLWTIGKGLVYVSGKGLAWVLTAAKGLMLGLWGFIKGIAIKIGAAFVAMGPVGWIILAIAAIVGLVYAWKNNLWGLRDWTINLFNSIGEAVKKVWDWFTDTPFGGAVEQILMRLFDGFINMLSTMIGFVVFLVDAIPGISDAWKSGMNDTIQGLNTGFFSEFPIRMFNESEPVPARITDAPTMMAPLYGPAAPPSAGSGFVDPVVEEYLELLAHPRLEGRLRAFEDPDSEGGSTITPREAGLLLTALENLADRPIVLDGMRLDAALRRRALRGATMGAPQ